MSSESAPSGNSSNNSGNNGKPRGGRGRGGRGRGGGRGGGGGGHRRPGNNNNNNGGMTNTDNGRATNFAGRGAKHFGNQQSRPDRVVPRTAAIASDDELSDDDNDDNDDNNYNDFRRNDVDNGTTADNAPDSTTAATATAFAKRTRHAYCLVCYSSSLPHQRAISPCGHDDVCAPCHLRLRHLHHDTKCPVCKTSNDTLIVDKDSLEIVEHDAQDGEHVHHKRFRQYEIWGNELGGGFVYQEDVGMHFQKDYHERVVLPLFGHACGLPRCGFMNSSDVYVNQKEEKEMDRNNANNNNNNNNNNANNSKPTNREVKKRLAGLTALKSHLRTDHNMTLCDLCVENKRDFISKLPRFTPTGLKSHQSKGDGDQSGFTGHPLCEFCRPLRFYDIVKLHEHLNKDHYKCHICDKMGRPNQFFKDYDKLALHFDREHFACHDPQCLAARFVVFENEIDLRGHEANVHGTSRRDGGTKIKLEFRVRREGEEQNLGHQQVPSGEDFQFGLDGEVFVPDALPGEELQRLLLQQQQQQRQVNEPNITNAVHAARTAELRAMAARTREQNTGTTEGGGGGGRGEMEAFPALGASSARGGGASLVGWTASNGGSGGASGTRLKKTPVGKVTEEEFPSLGGGKGASGNNRYAALGLRRPNAKAQGATGSANFSAVASRTNNSNHAAAAASRPLSTVSYASSMPVARAPDITANNFPSLGGGMKMAPPKSYGPTMTTATSSRAPVLGSSNFPSLASGKSSASSSNRYAAANELARKLNAGKAPGSAPSPSAYPSLSSSTDFPPPPASAGTSKRPNVATALAPKKPPPMDNMLQFPPPPAAAAAAASTKAASLPTNKNKPSAESLSTGIATVESLKERMGSVRYKKLKALTKSFASGVTPPEKYVEEAASLFDRGLGDEVFWQFVPDLIRSCPNEGGVNRALRHLESVRVANEMQEREFGNVGGVISGASKKVNYILPAKKKSANSWGNASGGQSANGKLTGSKVTSTTATMFDAKPPASYTAKMEAKTNNGGSTAGGGKKVKTKKKNNELKSLAFGL